jgi:hypothetical protein
VTAFDAMPETVRGRVTYRLLLGVHAAIRGDLERVERLAAQALDGLPAEQLRQELDEIRKNGMLWRLRIDCLRYCRFVHSHHNAEDIAFFPELRETNPPINPPSTDWRRITGPSPTISTRSRPRPTLSWPTRPSRAGKRWPTLSRPSPRSCSSTWPTRSATSRRRSSACETTT